MSWQILQGDCLAVLKTLPSESVQTCVTSPPYWGLRDYGVEGQLGLERTPEEYVSKMVEIFREVRRVLRNDGTLWLNLGDSYSGNATGCDTTKSTLGGGKQTQTIGGKRPDKFGDGLKPKDLCGIPWLVAFALRADGWYLRSEMPWIKRNAMPDSTLDRPGQSVEKIFLLTKSDRYFFDMEPVKVPSSSDHPSGNGFKRDARLSYMDDEGPRGNEQQWQVSPTRQLRNHDFFLKSWEGFLLADDGSPLALVVNPRGYAEAHFATFPPKLVEPCILAGTSERGCCAECGAPWERITEKSVTFNSGSGKAGNPPNGKNGEDYEQAVSGDYDIRMGPITETKTLGWQPTCDCTKPYMEDNGVPCDRIPCTVLDPFNGAGTTGLVSTRLGRNYIGIELNPQYVEMAERRIVGDAPLFNTPPTNEQMTFTEAE